MITSVVLNLEQFLYSTFKSSVTKETNPTLNINNGSCIQNTVAIYICFAVLFAGCSSMVRELRWVVGSLIHAAPTELFLVPASAPRLV